MIIAAGPKEKLIISEHELDEMANYFTQKGNELEAKIAEYTKTMDNMMLVGIQKGRTANQLRAYVADVKMLRGVIQQISESARADTLRFKQEMASFD